MYTPLRTIPLDLIRLWQTAVRPLAIPSGPGGSSMTADAPTRQVFAGGMLEAFVPPPWEWITLVALHPSSQIVAHRDPPPESIVRYHLPLLTNHRCWCFHGGVWQQLVVGQMYSMAPREEHGAVNWGTEIRVHLMIDRVEG